MNIPDGEYDIDVSVLGHSSSTETDHASLALRYGFIPDSMDQNRPLYLFQKDEVCVLEANSIERLKNVSSTSQNHAPPIIFEGVPQRQRSTQPGSSSAQDSFYLSFSSAEKSHGNELKVSLGRLESTVRVNKSRNADKWRALIRNWRNGTDGPAAKPPAASLELLSAPKTKRVSSPLLKRRPQKPLRNGGSESLRSKHIPSDKIAKPAGKRPPIASEKKNDIISVSDFEDLDSDEDDAFPVFEDVIDNTVKSSDSLSQKESQSSSHKRKTTTKNGDHGDNGDKNTGEEVEKVSERSRTSAESSEMHKKDDEFADLEDQLDEVLDDRVVSRSPVDSDSDDSDIGGFSGMPIIIDTGEDKSEKKSILSRHTATRTKPMSLRELYGGGKNDYLSSSEEE